MVEFEESERIQNGGREPFRRLLTGVVQGPGQLGIGFLRLHQSLSKLIALFFQRRGIEQGLGESLPHGNQLADGLHSVLFHQVVQEGHAVLHLFQPVGGDVDPGVCAFQFVHDVLQLQPGRFHPLHQRFQGRDETGGAGRLLFGFLQLGCERGTLVGGGQDVSAVVQEFLQLFRMGELLLLGLQFLQFSVPELRGVQALEQGLVVVFFCGKPLQSRRYLGALTWILRGF